MEVYFPLACPVAGECDLGAVVTPSRKQIDGPVASKGSRLVAVIVYYIDLFCLPQNSPS